MHNPAPQRLIDRWTRIANGELDPDEPDNTEALAYFRASIGATEARPSRRIVNWLTRFDELEAFVHAHGRMPRSGRSADQIRGEQRLADWSRYQRRSYDSLNQFQRELLETIRPFDWAPLDTTWDEHLESYLRFVELHHKRASLRSQDGHERRLAIWWRNQAALEGKGRLPHHRLVALRDTRRRIMDIIE